MVCESDMLLHHQDVFNMISKGGFTIAIPSNGAHQPQLCFAQRR